MGMISNFFLGFGFLIKGTRILCEQRSLLKWVIIPFLIDGLLIYYAFSWGIGFVDPALKWLLIWIFEEPGGFWYKVVSYPIKGILFIGVFALVTYVTFLLSTIISSPFNSVLAEKTLDQLNMRNQQPLSWDQRFQVSVRMFMAALIRSIIFVFIGLFIFGMSLLPMLGVASAVLVPLLGVISAFLSLLVIVFDSMDYSMEAMSMGLKERFRYFTKNQPYFWGMAAAFSCTLIIPGLTLLLLPVSVVGASWIMQQIEKRA